MSLFGRKEKEELARLRAQMTPEQLQLADLSEQITEAQKQLQAVQAQISAENNHLAEISSQIDAAKAQLIETDEAALLQSFGLYTPHYAYTTSDEYKEKLAEVRNAQKQMVKDGLAVTGSKNWTVNNSAAKGKKMVKDMQKLLLRAYNAECDDAIEHVRFNNIEACEKKIRASAAAISKLGTIMSIAVTPKYIDLKLDELRLMHEYQIKKQEEKEAAKEARAKQREEARVLKEMEEARKKLQKEQSHYQNALAQLNSQIAAASEADKLELEKKKQELENHLSDIDHQIKDVDYRTANQRAGYVYIISNIGAFGENVYKIGMTRRLDPMERVDELGDASVPFNFDVHAMIFSEDAPALEAALHHAFEERKLNMVNTRREFFRVSLDEIEAVVRKNYDKTVEFVRMPEAQQYRESEKMREAMADK